MFYFKEICILLLLPRCFTLLIPRYVTPLINGTDRYTTTTPGPDEEAAVRKELLKYAKHINAIPDKTNREVFRNDLWHLIQRAIKAETKNEKLLRMEGEEIRKLAEEKGVMKTLLNNETRILKEACKPIVISQKIRNKIDHLPEYGNAGTDNFLQRRDNIIKAVVDFRNRRPYSLFHVIQVFCFYADDTNRKNARNFSGIMQKTYTKLKSLNLHVDEEVKKTYKTFDKTLLEKIEALNDTIDSEDIARKWLCDIRYWGEKRRIWDVKNLKEENCYPTKMKEAERDTFELISDSLLCIEDVLGKLKLKTREEYDFVRIQLSQPKSYPLGIKEDPSTYKSCLWTFCHSKEAHFQTAVNIFKNISKITFDDELSTISRLCIKMSELSRLNSMHFFHKKDHELYKKVPIERKDVDEFVESVSENNQPLKAVIYSTAYLAGLIDDDDIGQIQQ